MKDLMIKVYDEKMKNASVMIEIDKHSIEEEEDIYWDFEY